jgi:hypothetical protein
MDAIKPWYFSRTIWAAAVAGLAALASMAGLPTGDLDKAALTDHILQLIGAAAAIAAALGRLAARSRIG